MCRRGFIRRTVWLLALLVTTVTPGLSAEPAPAVSASAVKAAYLVNFARFTTWAKLSERAEDPLIVGVYRDREVEEFVFKLTAGQKIQGHPIRVRRIVRPTEVAECHVVYFGAEPDEDSRACLAAAVRLPILTVSSQDAFLAGGGLIQFYPDENSIRFEIAAERASEAGLVLSSRLLALSRPLKTRGLSPVP